MNILGIDYGRKKIGLALATSLLAEPYCVIRPENIREAIKRVEKVVKVEKVERVIVGVSEGKIGEESENFSLNLSISLRRENPKVLVETWDETLSTREAQTASIEAGIKIKKRKQMEDAYAASIMLQSYIDSRL
jgi:putative Holliday junction resolvase